jgi:Na+-transporting methylmalonyl-CoA/oxaloacetate decarboxylase gamma subunit
MTDPELPAAGLAAAVAVGLGVAAGAAPVRDVVSVRGTGVVAAPLTWLAALLRGLAASAGRGVGEAQPDTSTAPSVALSASADAAAAFIEWISLPATHRAGSA